MAYKVPPSKKSKDQNRFEVDIDFDVKGKTETRHFELPSMRYIKPTVMAEAEGMVGQRSYQFLLAAVAPGLYELFDEVDQVTEFIKAWQEFSGITPGESSASSDS